MSRQIRLLFLVLSILTITSLTVTSVGCSIVEYLQELSAEHSAQRLPPVDNSP
jgi:hypothetical protein